MRIITQLLQVNAAKPDCARSSFNISKKFITYLLVQSNQSSSCINRIASLNKDLADCTVCPDNDLSLHLHLPSIKPTLLPSKTF